MPPVSRLPRRQRRAVFTASTFERRKRMTVPLSRDLRSRFGRRSLPVRKGDTVRVLAGSFVGREERVAKVNRRDYSVTLDNVTLKTAEEKLKPLALRTAHLVITRLNLADPWRRRALKVREEDVTPEERGEPAEAEAETAAVAPSPETAPAPTETAPPAEEEAAPEPAPAPRRSRAAAPKKEEEAEP